MFLVVSEGGSVHECSVSTAFDFIHPVFTIVTVPVHFCNEEVREETPDIISYRFGSSQDDISHNLVSAVLLDGLIF